MPFQAQYSVTAPRIVPPSDIVSGTRVGAPELLLASAVLPYSPTLMRLPLGAGSFDTPKVGSPRSIKAEVSRSLVVKTPSAGSYRPYSLWRWKSRLVESANFGSYPKLFLSLAKAVLVCQSIRNRSAARRSPPATLAPSCARMLL